VAQPFAPNDELLLLRLVRRRSLDLRQLELEQVELAIARARQVAQLRERAFQLPHARVDAGQLGAGNEVLRAAERVQQLELRAGQHQLAVLVLAVERQQRRRELLQVGRGRPAPVDVGPGAPRRGDTPRQHDVLAVGALEQPLDVGLVGPGPHDPRPRAAAQQQVQRVREHRLARAGLPGEDVQAGREAQLGPFDEEEVLDAQLQEHAPRMTFGSDGYGQGAHLVTATWR
jgi:hypothetical protein